MDKAKDIDEFVQKLAEPLSIGQTVRYDMDNLTYGEVHQLQMDEYWEYVEMDELPDNLEDELKDWEIDEVKYIREVLKLPDEIDPPRTWLQLEWMADFANEQSLGNRLSEMFRSHWIAVIHSVRSRMSCMTTISSTNGMATAKNVTVPTYATN